MEAPQERSAPKKKSTRAAEEEAAFRLRRPPPWRGVKVTKRRTATGFAVCMHFQL
jgi:hypothetical protein